MAKDTFYFTHDYNARNDIKIKKMMVEHGMVGYGIYWAIIEDLYNNANALPTDYKTIAFDLHVDMKLVQSIVNDFGLFVFDTDFFGSTSVEKRLDARNDKSIKARESAHKRWDKSNGNANALPPKSEPNAIKERKGKEIKGKEKKDSLSARKIDFGKTLEPFVEQFGRPMVNAFFKFWCEPNKSGTRLRKELQKTWDTKLRLENWASREPSFQKTTTADSSTPGKSPLSFSGKKNPTNQPTQ